jgi:two-component system response regulator YesN
MIVADDELWIRQRIINSIDWNRIGVTIEGEAADGEEALNLCMELQPDIILTDIRMPVLNGLEYIRMLRDNKIESKIVIISGYNEFEYAQQALKLGVFDYILKPVENDEMIKIIKKCIEKIEIETRNKDLLKQAYTLVKQPDSTMIDASQPAAMRKIIEKSLEYIHANYGKRITLTDVSDYIMLNPAYFSKIFKDSTGKPFIKYLTQFRLNKAKELLNNPSLKIYEIADMVGYDNVQYFIRVFKSSLGVSPTIYKERQ